MNRSTLRVSAMLAALALPALTVACAAPPPPPPAPQPVAAAMPPPPPPAPMALPKDVASDVDHHIMDLHDQLGITPEQQPQWEQFAAVMRNNAAEMRQAVDDRGSSLGGFNAADNMRSYAKLAQVHADNMQKLSSSFQTLYASLSDAQKVTADAVFRHEAAKKAAMHKHHAG